MLKELLLVTATALALGACSTSPQPVARAAPGQNGNAANCVSSSGTRLPGPPCRYPGSSYSAEEMQMTGQSDPGAALRMLDPRVTGH